MPINICFTAPSLLAFHSSFGAIPYSGVKDSVFDLLNLGLYIFWVLAKKMARSNVPQFGSWENQDSIPYTVCFDKARKTKEGKMINPNDLQGNPYNKPVMDPSRPVPAPRPKPRVKPEEPVVGGSARRMPDDNVSRDIKYKQFSNPPGRNGNMDQRIPSYGGQILRPNRQEHPIAGSELENSLHHPQYLVNDRKVTPPPAGGRLNDENGHSKPVRHRPMPVVRRDESPDRGTAVPEFGDWKAAENFTDVFNRVRDERNTPLAPAIMNDPKQPSLLPRDRPSNESKKGFCPWLCF